MLGQRSHQDVVQLDADEVHPVHEALEGVPRVPHSEGHNTELPQAEGSDDGGLGVVGGCSLTW